MAGLALSFELYLGENTMMQSLAALVFAVGTCLATSAIAREWTDLTGMFRAHGDYIGYANDYVWIHRDTGSVCRIRWDRLSATDQAFVRRLTAQHQATAANGVTLPSAAADRSEPATQRVAMQFPSLQEPAPGTTGDALQQQPLPDPFAPDPDPTMPQEQPTFPELPPMPQPQPAPDAASTAKVWKRVYTGCHVDFHLIVRSDIAYNWTSTVSYTLRERTPHGWVNKHYLANLQYSHANERYLHWNARFGDPSITQWRIARMPDHHGCHVVEAQTREGWKPIDCAYESVPH